MRKRRKAIGRDETPLSDSREESFHTSNGGFLVGLHKVRDGGGGYPALTFLLNSFGHEAEITILPTRKALKRLIEFLKTASKELKFTDEYPCAPAKVAGESDPRSVRTGKKRKKA